MKVDQEKVTLLAVAIKEFIEFINESDRLKYMNFIHQDKLLRLKLITEEFQFELIANELLRLNELEVEEQQTRILIARFKEAFVHVQSYIENNQDELFMFLGRVYTMENYCLLIQEKTTERA